MATATVLPAVGLGGYCRYTATGLYTRLLHHELCTAKEVGLLQGGHTPPYQDHAITATLEIQDCLVSSGCLISPAYGYGEWSGCIAWEVVRVCCMENGLDTLHGNWSGYGACESGQCMVYGRMVSDMLHGGFTIWTKSLLDCTASVCKQQKSR
jgi:hypothetical protein